MTDNKAHKRIMIAVDHSINSEYAFHETLKAIDKENDYLYIISVSQTVCTRIVMIDAQREGDQAVHTLLVHYVHLCKKAGVKNFKTFLGTGSHVGEVICRAVEEKYIDTLVLGRRGIGTLKRIFIGSTSRYCVEHASCTVTCYKLPPTLEDLPEHHVKFSDDVNKTSKETFVHQPHSAQSTPSSSDPSVNVAAVPMVERYSHPV